MRSARAIGFGLAFLFAGVMARAQQTPPTAKLTPNTPAVNKTTCEKSVAKIGTSAPAVAKADWFAAMDVNKDGKIGPTEFKRSKKAFAWVDTDHDGYITRPEATRAYLTIVGEMAIAQRVKAFKSMDENKDGKISLSEYRGPARAFARIDVNHDGVITAQEAKNAFQASVGRFVIAMRFRALDANHDGMISATEFKGPKAAFAKYAGKNGLIGPAQYAKMIRERAAARIMVATAKPVAAPAKPVAKATAKPVPTPVKSVAVVTKTNVVKAVKATKTAKSAKPAANVTGLNRILAMDTNKDGKVDMGEYFQAVEARFVRLDQDKDGYITACDLAKVAALRKTNATPTPAVATPVKTAVKPATLKPAKPAAVKPAALKPIKSTSTLKSEKPTVNHTGLNRILAMDTNKDGKIDMGEYFQAVEARFVRLDQDKDGYITACDLAKVAALRKTNATPTPVVATPVKTAVKPATLKPAKSAAIKPAALKPIKSTPSAKSAKPTANATRLNRVLAMDTNKDGKVDMGEYFKAVEARFVYLDQNKDGYITSCDLAKVAALRKTNATPTPVVATPVKSAVKPATLKPAAPAAVKPATLKPAKSAAGKPAAKPITAIKSVAATDKASLSKVDVAFDQIDVNHDGVLSRAEVKAYLATKAHKTPTKTIVTHKG